MKGNSTYVGAIYVAMYPKRINTSPKAAAGVLEATSTLAAHGTAMDDAGESATVLHATQCIR